MDDANHGITLSQLLKQWSREWWPHLLSLIGTIAFVLLGLEPSLYPHSWLVSHIWYFVAITVIVYLVGYGSSLKRERRLTTITEQLSSLRKQFDSAQQGFVELCEKELILLSRTLDFYSSERITLFIPNCVNGGFRVLARFSSHTLLRKIPRTVYSMQEGCLGRAWEEGSANCRYPKDEMAWKKAQKRWGISEEIASIMRMKSRDIVAIRIDSPDLSQDALGVLVFESQTESSILSGELNKFRAQVASISSDRLAALLQQVLKSGC